MEIKINLNPFHLDVDLHNQSLINEYCYYHTMKLGDYLIFFSDEKGTCYYQKIWPLGRN